MRLSGGEEVRRKAHLGVVGALRGGMLGTLRRALHPMDFPPHPASPQAWLKNWLKITEAIAAEQPRGEDKNMSGA